MAQTHLFELHKTIASLNSAQKQQLVHDLLATIGVADVLKACARGMSVSNRSLMMSKAQQIGLKMQAREMRPSISHHSLDNLPIVLIGNIGSYLRSMDYFALGRVNKTTYIATQKRPTLSDAHYPMRCIPRSYYAPLLLHRFSFIKELTVHVASFNQYERELRPNPNHNVRLHQLRKLTLCLTSWPLHRSLRKAWCEDLEEFLQTTIIDISLIERLFIITEPAETGREFPALYLPDFVSMKRAFRNLEVLDIADVNINTSLVHDHRWRDIDHDKLRFEKLESLIVSVSDQERWLCPFLEANAGTIRNLEIFGFCDMDMADDINQIEHPLRINELIIHQFRHNDNLQALLRKAPKLKIIKFKSVTKPCILQPTTFKELLSEPRSLNLVIPWNGFNLLQNIGNGVDHRRASIGGFVNLIMQIDEPLNEQQTSTLLDKLPPVLHRIGNNAAFHFSLLVSPCARLERYALVQRLKAMTPSTCEMLLKHFESDHFAVSLRKR